jgi:gluconolactonase
VIRGLVIASLLFGASVSSAQDYDTLQAERVATGLRYADGIVWSRDGFLVFADVLKRVVYRLDPGALAKPTPSDANGAQGLTYDTQGRLYFCELTTRRVTRMDRRGKAETVAENYQGRKFNSPNDIVVRRDGHIFFTDPAFGSAIDHRELDFNGIFHVSPKGEIDVVAKWQTRPNGIALSPDGRTLFVTDADRHAVVAFDVDKNGAAANQRDLIHHTDGVPGGLRVDVAGRLYIGESGLSVYSPEGKFEHRLLPGEIVTNCAFGDNDFETLYLTGRKAVYKVRLGVKGALQY